MEIPKAVTANPDNDLKTRLEDKKNQPEKNQPMVETTSEKTKLEYFTE